MRDSAQDSILDGDVTAHLQHAAPGSLALLDVTLPTVEENLALDEALLIEADVGRAGAVLRFWELPHLAVVLGASRRLAEDVLLENCLADQVPFARRSSGGGSVLIGPGALNVTVVLPESAAPGLASVPVAQRFVLERIAAAIEEHGREVEVLGYGDFTSAGLKFGGSAQRRLRNWFFVHCSILYDFPLDRISRYLKLPERQPAYRRGRSHQDFLRNLDLPRKIIHELIRQAWSPLAPLSTTPDVPQDLLSTLLTERFANRSWIERL
jgi:lipoate---protein ligase